LVDEGFDKFYMCYVNVIQYEGLDF